MRVWEIPAFGLDKLRVAERPDPVAGPSRVAVRIDACSLNYRDLLMIAGLYNPRQKLPLVPVSDGVGEVIAIGEGVTRVALGDRVLGAFSQRWIAGRPDRATPASTLGGPLDGMLAEGIVLSEDGVVRAPPHMSVEQACTLPCAAATAWNALIEHGHLAPGETVLVQGTGGVATFALQIAKLSGARVIATSSSDEKLARARELGADETINYVATPDWGKRARELTDGVGVDHVVEVGGAGTLAESIRAVRAGGQIALIGVLAGHETSLRITPVLMQSIRIQGVLVGPRQALERMCKALEQHRLEPVVDRVFAFADAPAAFAHLASGKHHGKVVIRAS